MTSQTFDILEYVSGFTHDGGSQTEKDQSFFCPSCGSGNFKVNLSTGKYFTYGCSCMDTKAGKRNVIEAITQHGWQKPHREAQKQIWVYHDSDGARLIEVHRQDNGDGNRRFWQHALQSGAPAELRDRARPYRYQECLDAIMRGEDVWWVEGEACADACWKNGIPATTTIGGSNGYCSEQYCDLFPEPAQGTGRLVLCPDRDQVGIKYMKAIANDYPWAKWCYPFPDSALWQRLQKNGGADIADWLAEGVSAETIRQTIGEQRTDIRGFKPDPPGQEVKKDSRPNQFKQQFEALAVLLGEQLRFNELTKDIELDGDPAEVGDLKVTLAVEEDLDIRVSNLEMMLQYLAKRQSYHPVREELNRCYAAHQDTTILEDLAQRYFGVSHPLYDIYLRRTLIAAVKRIFEPGCKVDTVLVLQGPQGYFKSSFFQTLAGVAYFDDSFGSMSDKDERLKLHLVWICEWAEVENAYRRRNNAAVKAFLSTGTDLVRAPYARKAERLPRQSIIVGSTNEDQFLNDATGNRRFWVVPVKQRIDVQQLAQEREQIWGAAMALYRAGEQCWLTPAEEQLSQEAVAAYQTSHPWESRIEAYLLEWSSSVVTTSEILTKALEIEIGRQTKRDQMAAAECLRQLGWQHVRLKHQGKRRWVWVNGDEHQETTGQDGAPSASVPSNAAQPLSAQPGRPPGQAIETNLGQPQTPPARGTQAPAGQPGQPVIPSFAQLAPRSSTPPAEPIDGNPEGAEPAVHLMQEEETGQGVLVETPPIDSWEGMPYE